MVKFGKFVEIPEICRVFEYFWVLVELLWCVLPALFVMRGLESNFNAVWFVNYRNYICFYVSQLIWNELHK